MTCVDLALLTLIITTRGDQSQASNLLKQAQPRATVLQLFSLWPVDYFIREGSRLVWVTQADLVWCLLPHTTRLDHRLTSNVRADCSRRINLRRQVLEQSQQKCGQIKHHVLDILGVLNDKMVDLFSETN
ncbi:hypothetical protein RRG08_042264 [Elysia crispata]|nr:hypothetical protein RRG08_042264 [Elysia crispata]